MTEPPRDVAERVPIVGTPVTGPVEETTPAAHHGAHPYYCPFCGEEDLRPHPGARAAWRCRGCARVFTLSLIGLQVQR